MLHLCAKRKWSMIILPKYNLNLSNGKAYLLTANSRVVLGFDLAKQYENESYSFRENTASPYKYCLEADCIKSWKWFTRVWQCIMYSNIGEFAT